MNVNYKLYQMKFLTPVRFGNGALESVNNTFCVDTLFSALCIEALHSYGAEGIDRLYAAAKNGDILFSDAMPYAGDTLFLPKPIIRIETEDRGDSKLKKQYKKLKYVPAEKFDDYLCGRLDIEQANAKINQLGVSHIETKTAVSRTADGKTDPYYVGAYTFGNNCGLYFLAAFGNDEAYRFSADLLHLLEYTGIGGKTSSGYGKFTVEETAVTAEMQRLIENAETSDRLITLSSCLPQDNELDKALEGASYSLQKRSGFIASETYAREYHKKRDMYTFKAGSCFKNAFKGDVYDVSDGIGHAVYRYAKPFFIGV